MAPAGVFPAAGEDRWIAIAVEDDAGWARFAGAIGRPELARDPRFATVALRKRNEDALEEAVAEWTRGQTPEAATERLQAAGVAAFTSATNRDLAEDAHLRARGFFVELDHPEVGRRIHAGVPWRMTTNDSRVRKAAPCLGADTDRVLRDVCGYDDAAIARLRDAGALA
jgi:crotonobetainyl-CoA:carnitine CoA-transferase CaiB-like acyl-CoA transferase